jgi:hypothetical protein
MKFLFMTIFSLNALCATIFFDSTTQHWILFNALVDFDSSDETV